MDDDQALIEYDEFCIRVSRAWQSPVIQMSQRYGQLYFNMLHELRPDVANKIRATPLDPFFYDDVSLETESAVINYWKI